jgi:uncharacterized protein (DUF302 family)
MRKQLLTLVLLLLPVLSPTALFAGETVFKLTIDKPVDAVYDSLYASLEEARFFVVFEPDIGRNLANFAERWGDDYNQNKLSAIRSMVFCNGWYANQVSNEDPDMLGLCPLHASVIGRNGKTTILFNRPSVIAVNSPALKLIKQIEDEVIDAIKASVR